MTPAEERRAAELICEITAELAAAREDVRELSVRVSELVWLSFLEKHPELGHKGGRS